MVGVVGDRWQYTVVYDSLPDTNDKELDIVWCVVGL